MDLMTLSSQQPGLAEVRAQFEQWRRSRGRRQAIPECLWDAAVSLYPALPLSRISKTLGLDYTKLKHHVHGQAPEPSLPAETAFIELGLAAVCRQVLQKDPFTGHVFIFRINWTNMR